MRLFDVGTLPARPRGPEDPYATARAVANVLLAMPGTQLIPPPPPAVSVAHTPSAPVERNALGLPVARPMAATALEVTSGAVAPCKGHVYDDVPGAEPDHAGQPRLRCLNLSLPDWPLCAGPCRAYEPSRRPRFGPDTTIMGDDGIARRRSDRSV
jgi:hypothetical protein